MPRHTPWSRVVAFPPAVLVIGAAVLVALAFAIHQFDLWIDPVGGVARLAIGCVETALFIAVYAWLATHVERRVPTEIATKGVISETLMGAVCGAALFSAVIALIAMLGAYRIVEVRPAWGVAGTLGLVIPAAVSEELLFRGLFFRLAEGWLGSGAALALSGLLFGLVHMGNDGANLIAGASVVTGGVLLAAVFMLTRRLWTAIGAHVAWNFVQGGVFGVPVSGHEWVGVLRSTVTGPVELTGGAFGAEASLPAVVVCAATTVLLVAHLWRRGGFVPRQPKPTQRLQ